MVLMTLNPPGQYADDRNLRARQRLWQHQDEVPRPWPDVVEDVRRAAQAVIDDRGAFLTYGAVAAFVCR